jgi:S1-C subfamily serine protease
MAQIAYYAQEVRRMRMQNKNGEGILTMRHFALWKLTFALIFTSAICANTQAYQSPHSKLEAPAIYEKATPAVVLITCVDAARRVSQGSGVILRADGIIATNYHVVSDAVSARVRLNNGDQYDNVSVVNTDARKDIAILKISAVNLPVLDLANSDNVKIGATVYTIGAPQGLAGSLTSGIVSSLRLASEVSPKLSGFRIIQFTAPISPGSSGSPLIDESGRLLGLAFASRVDGQNINLAVPVNYVVPLVGSAKNEGRSLKRMPNLETIESTSETPNSTINDIAGTYTGTWISDRYNVYGTLVMAVTVVSNQAQAKVALTGSDYIKEDALIINLTPMGDGVWKMDYKGKKSKITGTGFFRNAKFVGDYHFKNDRGKWNLQK